MASINPALAVDADVLQMASLEMEKPEKPAAQRFLI